MSRFKLLTLIICFMLVLSSCNSGGGTSNVSDVPVITAIPAESTDSPISTTVPTETPTEVPKVIEGPAVIETTNNSALRFISLNNDPSSVILTQEQIKAENKRMLESSDTLYDLSVYPESVSAAELKSMIESASLPSLPKYTDGGRTISQSELNVIAENRNISAISANIKPIYGVIVKRGNIRHIPSDMPFYSSADSPHDRIQETEIGAGQLVLVLHESKDGEFYYIQCEYYRGWIDKENVAVTESREDWLYFQNSEQFAIVTSAEFKLGDATYDLGARIPVVSGSGDELTLSVPVRQQDGTLKITEETANSYGLSVGYVPYTFENYVALAFKYEGYRYSWGGLNDSVDCSGFVMNVLRCFGLKVPRDTTPQRTVIGTHTDVSSLSASEKASKLSKITRPACVFINGHVRLYLGYENGIFYFIDSSVAGGGVALTAKSSVDNVLYICVIGG